jgi:ABC-type multidrug transport system ATPase subunit
MEIQVSSLGKRFNRQWLFRELDFTIKNHTAIIGPNGSGKSTFLQLLTGFTLPTEGKVTWRDESGLIPAEEQYRFLSVSAPYLELIEDFTLLEQLQFHFRFKGIRYEKSLEDLTTIGFFKGEETKLIRQFSSGMKQRLKLILALYSDVPVVFLDEPTTNLDVKGIEWYQNQIQQLQIPLLIVASNQEQEYLFCEEKINLETLKN